MSDFGQTCDGCRHYSVSPEEPTQGLCRAHPPQVSVYVMPMLNPLTRQQSLAPQVTANFPMVGGKNCWCSEWATKLKISGMN